MPTFAVAMCTFNGARFLEAQLDSIARQTRPPDELVICDDRSGDQTPALVERFTATAPFPVRFEVNPRTLGSSRNFERAIERCDSDFIALSDQDDFWLPHKLERLETALRSGGEPGLVISNAEVVDRDLVPLGYDLWKWVGFRMDTATPTMEQGFHLALMAGISFGITMAFRARYRPWMTPIPDNPVVFKSSLPLHDKWIAMLAAAVAPIVLVPEKLTLYRQHPDQLTGAATLARTVSRDASPLAVPRRDLFERAAADFVRLRDKILANPGHRLTSSNRGELNDLIAHLEARARMPHPRLRRMPVVLRELGSGRYARFGNGWRSAMKDIL